MRSKPARELTPGDTLFLSSGNVERVRSVLTRDGRVGVSTDAGTVRTFRAFQMVHVLGD